MTTIVIEPPCDLINANDRLHYQAKAKLTKAWRMVAFAAAYKTPPVTGPAHITVAIRFPTDHRRDVMNYAPTAKAIVDGVVDAGVLEDDSDLHIIGPDMRRERPNGPLRVTVSIQEAA